MGSETKRCASCGPQFDPARCNRKPEFCDATPTPAADGEAKEREAVNVASFIRENARAMERAGWEHEDVWAQGRAADLLVQQSAMLDGLSAALDDINAALGLRPGHCTVPEDALQAIAALRARPALPADDEPTLAKANAWADDVRLSLESRTHKPWSREGHLIVEIQAQLRDARAALGLRPGEPLRAVLMKDGLPADVQAVVEDAERIVEELQREAFFDDARIIKTLLAHLTREAR